MYKVERGNVPVAKFFAKFNELSLPAASLSLPMMTIYGNETFIIEQFERLTFFSQNKISFHYENGKVELIGSNLWIDMMFPSEMIIKGQIEKVIFSNNRRREK